MNRKELKGQSTDVVVVVNSEGRYVGCLFHLLRGWSYNGVEFFPYRYRALRQLMQERMGRKHVKRNRVKHLAQSTQ